MARRIDYLFNNPRFSYCDIIILGSDYMNREKLWKTINIVLLFLLLYVIQAGSYLNAGIYTDQQSNMYAVIDLLIISTICMIVPLVWRILNHQKFACEKGKKICRWNSIIVLIISLILKAGTEIGLVGGLGSVVYYYINKWLFVDETKKDSDEKIKNTKPTQNKSNNDIKYVCEKCNHRVKDDDLYCPHCGDSLVEIEEIKKEIKNINENITKKDLKVKKKTIYCKNCGGKLNDDKKCTKCGKQYFKLNKTISLYIVIGILVSTNVITLLLYNDIRRDYGYFIDGDYYEDVEGEIINTCGTALEQIKNKRKINFLDDYIVIVPEDSKYYYSYDCYIENYSNYDFYATNIDNAITEGYKKGTC